MKEINSYIIERLHLNKDIEVEDVKYILFHKAATHNPWVAGVHKTLYDVAYYIKHHTSLGAHYIYKCPAELTREFIKKWKSSGENGHYKNVVSNDKELKDWTEDNKIKEIHSDEINKYFH